VNVDIHRVTADERDLAAEIVCEYLRAIGDFVDREEVEEEVERHVRAAGHAILLARGGDGVMGCVEVHPMPDASDCEVKRLYIRPDFRRRGLAAALMAAAEAFAREQSYAAIYLDTKSRMIEAIALYQGLGYERVPPYHETRRAEVFFRKPLSSMSTSSQA
jgi:ribosomal protein S18 acetylase RimI-like enzyme